MQKCINYKKVKPKRLMKTILQGDSKGKYYNLLHFITLLQFASIFITLFISIIEFIPEIEETKKENDSILEDFDIIFQNKDIDFENYGYIKLMC